MRILLVRHGQSEGNVDPSVHRRMPDHAIPLSETGKRQAYEAGLSIAGWLQENVSANDHVRLWTSPYTRTRQTSDQITQAVVDNGRSITDRREHLLLIEQQFGLFDGLTARERRDQYPAESHHYNVAEEFEGRFWVRMPLGESRFDVATRVHQSFGTFHRDARNGVNTIIVVAHGVTVRMFAMMWLHHEWEWSERTPNPNNASVQLIDGDTDCGFIHPGEPKQAGTATRGGS